MIAIDKSAVESDVLIVGGGIAGLMAAINAAKNGAKATLAEKANTRRSGCGATGNDHFMCYIPEVHGNDIRPIIDEYNQSQVGGFSDHSLASIFLEQSFARVKDWDRWGISMKPKGRWDFSGHAFPGRPRIWLKYAGHNQKAILTKEAKKRNVDITNHLSITDIISENGEVVGAIGLDTTNKKPLLKFIRAKSVVIATGCGSRLYPSPTPGWMFNTANCPVCTGSGHAMVYRAGAKLVNMEFPNRHAGPKYFARCGKATWIGVYKDPHGHPVGPFVTRATRELGDITGDIWSSVFTEKFKSGEGPVYIDCSATTKNDLDYMMWGLVQEGNTGMLNYMAAEGIDVRRHAIEFMQYEPFLVGRGIEIDQNAETNIRGLYAAGDPVGNFRADCAGAATFGWIAGRSAAKRSKHISGFHEFENNPYVRDRVEFYSEIMSRKTGPSWQEANLTLQQIMNDYAGAGGRSETLLKAGLTYLRGLEQRVTDTLKADNPHTLMRCLETIDLISCGEAIFLTALERNETRGKHIRLDYPFTNPLLENKFITICKQDNKLRLEWRQRH